MASFDRLDVFALVLPEGRSLPDCPHCGSLFPGVSLIPQKAGGVIAEPACNCFDIARLGGESQAEFFHPWEKVSQVFDSFGVDVLAFSNDPGFARDLSLSVSEFCQGRKALESLPEGIRQ